MGIVKVSRARARHAWALGLAALALSPGCSWLFVTPLEQHPAGRRTCTTNVAAPVLDTLFATTNVVSALYVASADGVTNKGQAVTLGLSVATLWALSAGYGYSKTSECAAWYGEDRTPPARAVAPSPYSSPRVWAPPPPPPPPVAAPPPLPLAPPV
ncbi:MAG: hypothetical protein JWM82_1788, partial [Myxococcales bacterium]|nr:hypothetical protein [Myxococcales bacterium]